MSAAERREQLLDVALEILCTQGASALSIDAIAKGAGITRPVVYTQFGDLEGLISALVEREEAQVLQQLAKAIPLSVGEVDPDEVIVGAIQTFLTAVAERPLTWQIVLTPPQGMPRSMHDKVVERREAVIDQITPLIAWGVTKRGGPSGLDHRLLARIILVLAEEAGRLVITQPETFTPERLVEQSKRLVAALIIDDPAVLAANAAAAATGIEGTPPGPDPAPAADALEPAGVSEKPAAKPRTSRAKGTAAPKSAGGKAPAKSPRSAKA